MKKKKFIFISVVFLFIVSSFCLLEIYFKKNDFFNIFNGKIVVLNLLKGFIPDNEKIIIDDFEIKVPYGYEKITNDTAIGLFVNINKLKNTMNDRYDFVDQLGSVYAWQDSVNNKQISIYVKRYANINYLRIRIKDI